MNLYSIKHLITVRTHNGDLIVASRDANDPIQLVRQTTAKTLQVQPRNGAEYEVYTSDPQASIMQMFGYVPQKLRLKISVQCNGTIDQELMQKNADDEPDITGFVVGKLLATASNIFQSLFEHATKIKPLLAEVKLVSCKPAREHSAFDGHLGTYTFDLVITCRDEHVFELTDVINDSDDVNIFVKLLEKEKICSEFGASAVYITKATLQLLV